MNFQLQSNLSRNSVLFCIYTIIAACSTYAFMYGFRKPIAVGLFQEESLFGLSLKALYLASQIFGYALSKFIGIKIISELQSHGREKAILFLVTIAWLALLGFALIPAPWNSVFMLINGLPLGMVWGIVFSYLEGRRVTEVLAAGLCTSFIVASGLVKSVGSYLMLDWSVSEYWMPFATATVFFPLLGLSVWMLSQVPPPNPQDIAHRKKREPMTKSDRKALLHALGFGLTLLIIGYILLTILRDLRDSFMADIWLETGLSGTPALFTYTEIPIALVVLAIVALLKLIRNNHVAMVVNHALILVGFLLCFCTSLAYANQMLEPITWMVLNGIGLYLAYVPFTSSLFERLIATFNRPANVGFLTYLADSFGYLGTVGVMLYQSLSTSEVNWNTFLTQLSIVTGLVGGVLTFGSLLFFIRKEREERSNSPALPLAGAIN